MTIHLGKNSKMLYKRDRWCIVLAPDCLEIHENGELITWCCEEHGYGEWDKCGSSESHVCKGLPEDIVRHYTFFKGMLA